MNVKLNWPRPRFSVSKTYQVNKTTGDNHQLQNDLGDFEYVSKHDTYPVTLRGDDNKGMQD